ncbi:hypothetical protein WMW72_33385 [Paenibacillus filicis]|uniref:Uncharacterized protein n=1 Tax=Paenibacillus filicis TaxID=669464 RepID=A0ABU9DV83_9BACL
MILINVHLEWDGLLIIVGESSPAVKRFQYCPIRAKLCPSNRKTRKNRVPIIHLKDMTRDHREHSPKSEAIVSTSSRVLQWSERGGIE